MRCLVEDDWRVQEMRSTNVDLYSCLVLEHDVLCECD